MKSLGRTAAKCCLLIELFVVHIAMGQIIIRPRPETDSYSRADALRKEGKNQEALTAINQAIRFDSDCGRCFGLRSGIQGNLGKFREGVADGDIGIRRSKNPRDKALGAYNMGFNLEGLNRLSEALSAYEDCIRFDSIFAMCYFGKGKTLLRIDNYQGALDALETATILTPTHGPSWTFKAVANGKSSNREASLSDALTAVQLAPYDARSYLARAYAYGLNSKYEEMLYDAGRALEIDPKRERAHLLKGQALRFLGRNEEAAQEFELEPDRQAVTNYLHPETRANTRVYNCGDSSTEFELPGGARIDTFADCKQRIDSLSDSAAQTAPRPLKKSVPNLPARRRPQQ